MGRHFQQHPARSLPRTRKSETFPTGNWWDATYVKNIRCSTEYLHSCLQAEDEAHLKPTVCFFWSRHKREPLKRWNKRCLGLQSWWGTHLGPRILSEQPQQAAGENQTKADGINDDGYRIGCHLPIYVFIWEKYGQGQSSALVIHGRITTDDLLRQTWIIDWWRERIELWCNSNDNGPNRWIVDDGIIDCAGKIIHRCQIKVNCQIRKSMSLFSFHHSESGS